MGNQPDHQSLPPEPPTQRYWARSSIGPRRAGSSSGHARSRPHVKVEGCSGFQTSRQGHSDQGEPQQAAALLELLSSTTDPIALMDRIDKRTRYGDGPGPEPWTYTAPVLDALVPRQGPVKLDLRTA